MYLNERELTEAKNVQTHTCSLTNTHIMTVSMIFQPCFPKAKTIRVKSEQ